MTDGHAPQVPVATKRARPLWAACGAVVMAVLPLLGLMVARGPVDGAGDLTEGFWGAKTASVNWCEADYAVTAYIAEFWNSLSSLAIVVIGSYGMWMHWRAVEPRYVVAFASFIVVGLGSAAFHGTLWRSMQLLDELPMLWADGVFIYILITMEDDMDREPRRGLMFAFAAAEVLMTLAVIILDTSSQDVFLLFYGSQTLYLFVASGRYDVKYNAPGTVMLLETGLLFYGGGFLLWLVDRNFCPHVSMLYLHVFWHVFAGLGTFSSILFWIWIRHEFLGLRPVLRGATPLTRWVEAGEKLV
ncbi:unnamed protein product [Prorocentrum cordatum]|uniref:Alkaline ceramidase n=1 Tax=Prorocentrum cordatum TaxID=2364126 RepID=A0ABN9WCR8_9DINO|nr:unnamed protein product [Polarella glacialis]